MPRTKVITKKAIDIAAEAEIGANGVRGFTLKGVANRMNATEQSVIGNESNRDQILDRFVTTRMQDFRSTVPEVANPNDVEGDLRKLVKSYDAIYQNAAATTLQILAMSVRYQMDGAFAFKDLTDNQKKTATLERDLSDSMIDKDRKTGNQLAEFLQAHVAFGNLKDVELNQIWLLLLGPVFMWRILNAAGLGKIDPPFKNKPADPNTVVATVMAQFATTLGKERSKAARAAEKDESRHE